VVASDADLPMGTWQVHVRSLKNSDARAVGDGPTLVFLHDSLGCIETWRGFPGRLAEDTKLDGLIYDRRGYGRSSPLPRATRAPDYLEGEAALLIDVLDEVGVERAALFGHSDGGSIALIAAARYPERISAVVTEGAHVFVEELTLDGIRAARHTLQSTGLRDRLARYHGDKTDAMTSAWIDTWLAPEFRDWNIECHLGAIECPVLAIQGVRDEYGTPAQVDAIVRGVGANARGWMVPDVGHTPHRDAPEAVLDTTARFITNALARPVQR
jgi:pimeloyl-ACP methyl ester carboxylesterase